MRKVDTAFPALVIGAFLLFFGWFVAFLMVVYDNPHRIEMSIIAYIFSLIGLALSTYGIAQKLALKRRKPGSNM